MIKTNTPLIIVLIAMVLSGFLPVVENTTLAAAEAPVSSPGKYSGFSPVLYDGYKIFSQYVTVRDGTKLAVDIIRPTLEGGLVEKPLPVVWMHTPYNRRYYGPVLTAKMYPGAALGLVKYGYVVGVVDQRGMYASYGTTYSGGSWDAYDMTEWFASQPWSDGNIGMWGCSATGASQLAAANLMPPSLKAIFPMSCGFSSRRGASLPADTPSYPSDTDKPGEIPANDAIAVAVDEDVDKAMLNLAKAEHRYNYLRRWPTPVSLDQLEKSGVAMYNAVNWWDNSGSPLATFIRFNNLNNPSKLLVAPGTHCIYCTEDSPKPAPWDFKIVLEELRWFDYWLKGIDNGIMNEPPIYYYTDKAPGDEDEAWRFSWQWPLPSETQINYYLEAGPSGLGSGVNDGILSTTPPATADAADIYTTDYSIDTKLVMAKGAPESLRMLITQPEASTKGLTYTTTPFESDTEITGHPVVHLWISSTATDGDFWVELEDIAPDGAADSMIAACSPGNSLEGRFIPGRPLPESINGIRASYRTLKSPDFKNWGLPYHRNSPEDIKPLNPGEPTELVFDLRPVSHVIKAGHRIRMTVTCVITDATPRVSPAPKVTFYRNPKYSSYIRLPVIQPVPVEVQVEKRWFKMVAKITFPDTLDPRYLQDIDTDFITCNGISAKKTVLEGNTLEAVFSKKSFSNVDALEVKGKFGRHFNYGNMTFAGIGTVR